MQTENERKEPTDESGVDRSDMLDAATVKKALNYLVRSVRHELQMLADLERSDRLMGCRRGLTQIDDRERVVKAYELASDRIDKISSMVDEIPSSNNN